MENSSPLYYYYQMNVPMTKNMDHFKMDWKKPYNVLPTCSPNEFLLKSKRQYMYFSTPFKEYDESLNEYIQPNHLFKLGKDLQFNFWLSTQNVTSQCHFDSAPNFYLQIHGRKKFIFFSPADWSNIYIFPRLHPATRQSQVNFSKYYETTFLGLSSPDPTFPNFAKSQPLEITLSPGDFLYLPPFWFHHVIVLDDLSVSISLYHEGLKESLLKIYSKPFPLHDFRRADQEMVVYLYIEKLIKSLLVHQEPKTFILKIIEAKYSHLHLDPLLTNSAEAFGYKFHIVTYILRSLGLKSKTFCASSSNTNLLESPIIQEHYQNVERFFTNLDANLVELLLSDYIEELLSYLVGPDKILSYMEDCFNLSPLQILNTSPTTQYL
uniref:JmjC domain-containing protein n=1 Tax=Arcella intermedia TaxID=1963864 RepID=A0A6B2L709_9EUKA